MDEYAGLPVGIEGEELVIEPGYQWAHIFNGDETYADEISKAANDDLSIRNSFFSTRLRRHVLIYEERGKIGKMIYGAHRLDLEMRTSGCSVAWGVEQESNALRTLGEMVSHHKFKMYALSGAFFESSKRSGVTYMFRRLRPTIALTADKKTGGMRALAALCMHPIGYYQRSHAGAMCPTDDVIAHLAMMRADEHMYWKRCNQHAQEYPEAAI